MGTKENCSAKSLVEFNLELEQKSYTIEHNVHACGWSKMPIYNTLVPWPVRDQLYYFLKCWNVEIYFLQIRKYCEGKYWIFSNIAFVEMNIWKSINYSTTTSVEIAKVLLHYISVASIFHNTIIFKFKVKANTYNLQCGGKLGKPK